MPNNQVVRPERKGAHTPDLSDAAWTTAPLLTSASAQVQVSGYNLLPFYFDKQTLMLSTIERALRHAQPSHSVADPVGAQEFANIRMKVVTFDS